MILKKKKAVFAALLSAAMAVAAVVPTTVSAAGTRDKEEKYGDASYAQRFLSLYDDVITNGQESGYLSKNNVPNGGFGIPYHAVEELIIEAPDYGHETTSEAMSYIVWMAAMRDNISQNGKITNPDGSETEVDKSSDLIKAWRTMEAMIPGANGYGKQPNFMNASLEATYSAEWETPELYTGSSMEMNQSIKGHNPIASYFKVYGDEGLYLMHWLADVDNWYGWGGNNTDFIFINTFQRGARESCWETVPHPAICDTKDKANVKKVFKGDSEANQDITPQWAYTNAPDAEDRAIQAVYAANRWGVGNSEVSALAGKMGDELRNDMFDKYYKEPAASGNDYAGAHYLRAWYTSWGGAMDGAWAWQIGASGCHEFYQNPLAAYALLADSSLEMKGTNAKEDYKKSLQRQLEFYLWLQSADGPIAGGATTSWNGRYETPKYSTETYYESEVDCGEYATESESAHFNGATPTTFYGMSYQEHPVYLDPGSNHWIGNQVWAVQRLAELYYVVKTEGDATPDVKPGGLSVEQALKTILDRWVEWFVNEVELNDDGTFTIPASLNWSGQPANWTGTYSATANAGLTCEVVATGSSDLGCVSSLANTLIYYAKANDVPYTAAYTSKNTDTAAKGLYLAHALLDREWELGRDNIGLSLPETNGNFIRFFEQKVVIPTAAEGYKMPNGEVLKNGMSFYDLRQKYKDNETVKKYQAAYDTVGSSASLEDKKAAMETVENNYHRFWHAGDILLALGTMYELYPEVEPDYYDEKSNPDDFTVDSNIEVEVDESKQITPSPAGDYTFESADPSIAEVDADGNVTGKKEGETDITVKKGDTEKTVHVTVTDSSSPTSVAPTGDISNAHWGDTNVDNGVHADDVVLLNQYLIDQSATADKITDQGLINANCVYDADLNSDDANAILQYVAEVIAYEELGPQE